MGEVEKLERRVTKKRVRKRRRTTGDPRLREQDQELRYRSGLQEVGVLRGDV